MIIEYRYPFEQEVFFGHEVLHGNHVLMEMRKLGIPVLGFLTPVGVTHGSLKFFMEENLDNEMERVYRWEGEKRHVVAATVEDDEL